MPEHNIKLLMENGAFSALLGGLGGIARLATGLAPNESIVAEIFRLIFIAMPIGWLSGGLAGDYGASEYMTHSIAVFAGLSSHNIAKAAMEIGVLEVIKIVTGRK